MFSLERRLMLKDAVSFAVLLMLVSFPIFFRFDFGKTDFNVLDFVSVVPNASWVYLIILCTLLAIYIWILPGKHTTLLLPVVISLVFFGLLTLSQYPAYSDKDYFMHGRVARYITMNGSIPPITDRYVYAQFPGAFVVWSIASIVLGINNEVETAWMLTIPFQVLTVLSFYILARKKLGSFYAGLYPTLFLLSNLIYTRDKFDHFCPQLFVLPLYIITFHIFSNWEASKNRSWVLLFILISSSILISHPITPAFLVLSMLFVWGMRSYAQKKYDFSELWHTLFVFTVWFAWFVNTPQLFEFAVNAAYGFLLYQSLFSSFGKRIGAHVSPYQIEDVSKRLLVDGLRIWKYAFDLMILGAALYVVFRLRRKKENATISGFLIGTLAAGAIISLYILWTSRIIFFVLIPACYLALLFLSKHVKKKVLAFLMIFIMIPSMLGVYSSSSEYGDYIHPWETYSIVFLSNHNLDKRLLVKSDFNTKVVHAFYDPESEYVKGIADILTVMNYSRDLRENTLIKEGDFIIRSFKQEVECTLSGYSPGEVDARFYRVDSILNTSTYNRIFDNGYVQIYDKH